MQKRKYTIGKKQDLIKERERSLDTPVIKSNFILKLLVVTLDLFYGKARTLEKFKVLEILARYPYWAWEDRAYRRLSKLTATCNEPSRDAVDAQLYLINFGREAQDNEQWHMLLLEEILEKRAVKLNPLLHKFLPRLLAFKYYHITRIMFLFSPRAAFRMNAAFESHAEHQYMLMSKEHPEWDEEEIDSKYFDLYPRQKTLGDLIRRIGLDERDHMNHSLDEIDKLEKTDER